MVITAVASRILTRSSSARRQLIDITEDVLEFVRDSHVTNGICVVSAPHATAAILANENEGGLVKDILSKIEDLFPKMGKYAHNLIDDNADAHMAAAFLGHSRIFPVVSHRLARGTWQNIFLLELDGPRSRRQVDLQIVGEV